MSALIGVDPELAEKVAERRRAEGGRLEVANINAPGQVVVAGGVDDLEWVAVNGGDLGIRRVVALKVDGAFHSSFMEPALDAVESALTSVPFVEPHFPIWSNTTARPHSVEGLTSTLRTQMVSPVLFQESLEDMARHGIDTFVHVGPGNVTASMAKRTVEGATVHVVSELADIPAVADALVTVT